MQIVCIGYQQAMKISTTVMLTKSDSDVILCLQLQSKNKLYSTLDLAQIDRSLVY